MKKVIRFIVISLAPIAILLAYIACHLWASAYAKRYFEMWPVMIAIIIGYLLIGIALLFICKKTLDGKETTRIPFEFLIGILFLIISYLYYFLPEVPFPEIFAFVPGFGMPITGLFIGVYSMLFVILLRRRSKVRKARKAEQDNQASV